MTGESYLLYLSWRHTYPHEDFLLFLLLPLPSVLASSVRLSAPGLRILHFAANHADNARQNNPN